MIAPELFITEATNVFWKLYQFDNMPIEQSNKLLDKTIELIDDFYPVDELYTEAFHFSCLINHPVYDSLYLTLARRNAAHLMSVDKKLCKIAIKQSINTI